MCYLVPKDLYLLVHVVYATVKFNLLLKTRFFNLSLNHAKIFRHDVIFELINKVIDNADF